MQLSPETQRRYREETPLWAANCAKIVNKQRQLVPLVPNGPQERFDRALEQQRLAGRPIRAIVLKARQLGFSTWGIAKLMQRITQLEFRRGLILAQENSTASNLFGMADIMWSHLPADEGLGLKPYRTNYEQGAYMKFGEQSRIRRNAGILGLDSDLSISTARELEGGRGFTFTDVVATEVAFYRDPSKLTAVLNAIPDVPGSIVILESTANGLNFFYDRWMAAVEGQSEYVPVFAGWTEDPAYMTPFYDDEAREEFVASIGTGPWGEDEQALIDEHGCTPEQLHWRRKTIVDKTEGKLEVFKQEYPTTPEEAFMLSGKQVFSTVFVARARRAAEQTDPKFTSPDNPGPDLGELAGGDFFTARRRGNTFEVPRSAVWTPKDGMLPNPWRVWEHPDPGQEPNEAEGEPGRRRGAYIVSCDPSGGEENEKGDTAFHAIQVIDHRTKRQVAEWRSRMDPDEVAMQMLLAALYFNRALVVAEITGGYGSFMLRTLRRDYGYPLVYKRKPLAKDRDNTEDTLGWNTSPATKPFLIGHAKELLRDNFGDDAEDGGVIRSLILATEFATYVKDERGKMEPLGNAFADLLMAWCIGQYVAHEKPVPDEEPSTTSSTGRRRKVKDRVTGY